MGRDVDKHGCRTTWSGTSRTLTITLVGDHDISTAHDVRRALLDAGAKAVLIVVDLAACTFLDSTVVGVLVSGAKRGHRLIVINAHDLPARTLKLTGVNQLVPVYELAGPLPDVPVTV